jgi:3-methyladenine DNA glycosylase/8-oxoguanine DNA glycosylase
VIEITEGDGDFLLLSVPTSLWEHVHKSVASARRLFDLDSDPLVIGRQLAADKLLAKLVRKDVAVRLPGCWDPFEMSVRAILGQQISVAGATTICGRLIEKWGEKNREGKHPAWTFPDPARLARVDVAKIGMPATRAQTVRTFSRAVARGEVRLDGSVGLEQLILELTALPGIGDWTANYIAMRACGEPDAFPAGDLGVRKALSSGDRLISEREVLQIAEQWKPWRAYAAILLWKNL